MKISIYPILCVFLISLSGCLDAGVLPGEAQNNATGGDDSSGGGTVITLTPNLVATPADSQVQLDWTTTGDQSTLIRVDAGQLYSGSGTSYTDTSVTNGNTYCYYVTAVDTATGATGTSSEVCAMPMAGVLPVVTNMSLKASITWTSVNNATSYDLFTLPPQPAMPSISKSMYKAAGDPGTFLANVPQPVVGDPVYEWENLSNCMDYQIGVVPIIDGVESWVDRVFVDVRPSSAGEFSPTFENGGMVIEGTVDSVFWDVDLLSDGRIVAMESDGATDSNVYIYSPDGASLLVFSVTAVIDIATDIVIDEDDNIYVAGQGDGPPQDMRVCKFTPTGALVTSFGGAAPAPAGCFYFNEDDSIANDIIIEPVSGDVIIAGGREDADAYLAIWRLTSDGDLLWAFSTETALPPGTDGIANAVAIVDDVIMAVGYELSFIQLMVVTVDADGNFLDHADHAGAGLGAVGYGITTAPDGTFVVTGLTTDGGAQRYAGLWNFATDLSLESDVYYAFSIGAGVGSTGLAVEYDCRGRVLVSGVDNPAPGLINIAALRTDDTFGIDPDFGNESGWFIDVDLQPVVVWAMTQDELGRIYAVGMRDEGAPPRRPLLMRLQ